MFSNQTWTVSLFTLHSSSLTSHAQCSSVDKSQYDNNNYYETLIPPLGRFGQLQYSFTIAAVGIYPDWTVLVY